MKKRILSGILCLALLVGTWSPVLAEETDLSGAEVLQTEDLPEIEAGIPEVENPVEKESEITEDVVAGEGETEETEIEDVNMDSALIDESESAEETEEDKKVEEEPVVEGMPDPLTGLDSRWYLGSIHAQEAWAALPASGNKVKVGIIDTGFRIGAGNLYDSVLNQGQSFQLVNGVKTPIADDVVNYHGTDVANIFTSVCGDTAAANMVDLVLADVAGDSSIARAEDVANAIRSLTDLGCKVLSISLGTVGSNSYLAGACEYAVSKGTIIVCADGTGEDSNEYLASLETTISVAAMTENGGILYSGNGGNANIAAPGNRTSYAAPVVAAAAAMMKYSGTSNGTLWNPEEKVETDSGKMLSSLNLQYAVGAGAGFSLEQIEIKEIEDEIHSFNGDEVCPKVCVTSDGYQLQQGRDYKVSYKNNKYPGSAWVIVEGISFAGTVVHEFEIQQAEGGTFDVGLLGFWDYTGNPIEPIPDMSDLFLDAKETGMSITNIKYSNNTEIGLATGEGVTTGNIKHRIKFSFLIVEDMEKIIDDIKVENFKPSVPIDSVLNKDGITIQTDIRISVYGYEIDGSNFSVEYENNNHVGKDAKMIIEGITFKGKKEYLFEITPLDVGDIEYGHIGDFLYSGEKIEPVFTDCRNCIKKSDTSNLPSDVWETPLNQWGQFCTLTPKYDCNTVDPGEVSGVFELDGDLTGRIHFTYSIIDNISLTEPVTIEPIDGFTWTLDMDGVLTVTGKGEPAFDSYYFDDFKKTYGKYIKKIVIEEGITSLPYIYMFSGLSNLTQVKLPTTIKWIGIRTFSDCVSLTEVENYEPLITTDAKFSEVFCRTPFLEKFLSEHPDYTDPIYVDDRYEDDSEEYEDTWVGERIEPFPGETSIQLFFDDDDTIYRLYEKSGVLTLEAPERPEDDSFLHIKMKAHDWSEYVDQIKAIKILDICTEIPDNAFSGLMNLESFETGNTWGIGKNAFFGCESLRNVCIYNSWGNVSVDDYAFGNCYALENFDIKGRRVDFSDGEGKFAFANCKKIKFMHITHASIPEYAFYGCEELGGIDMEYKIVSPEYTIGAYAFAKCEKFSIFSGCLAGCTSIGEYAFADCKSLLVFYAEWLFSVQNIGKNAFANIPGRQQVDLTYPLDEALDEYYKNYSNSYHEVNILFQMVDAVVNGTGSSATETQPKPEEQSKPTSTTLQEQSKPGTTTSQGQSKPGNTTQQEQGNPGITSTQGQSNPGTPSSQGQSNPGTINSQGQNQPDSATPQESSNSTTSIPQNPTAQSSQNAHGNAAATAEANAEEDTSLDSKEHDVPATQQSTSFLNQQEEQNQMGTPVIFLVIPMVLLAGIILTVLILYRKRFR